MSELVDCPFCSLPMFEIPKPHYGIAYFCGSETCIAENYEFGKPLIDAIKNRKPEPGQPVTFIGVDGIHVNAQWVRDIRGKLADTDYKLQRLETKQPAAGQSEPVAATDEQIQEWNDRHGVEHGIALTDLRACFEDAQTLIQPIPAAPAVPEGWKIKAIDLAEDICMLEIISPKGAKVTVPSYEGMGNYQSIKDMQTELAASPDQQGGAEQTNATSEARRSGKV